MMFNPYNLFHLGGIVRLPEDVGFCDVLMAGIILLFRRKLALAESWDQNIRSQTLPNIRQSAQL